VNEAQFAAVFEAEPLAIVQGKRISRVTHVARIALLLAAASVVGLALTRNGAFAAVGTILLLVAFFSEQLRARFPHSRERVTTFADMTRQAKHCARYS
jgi:hypothetical protein